MRLGRVPCRVMARRARRPVLRLGNRDGLSAPRQRDLRRSGSSAADLDDTEQRRRALTPQLEIPLNDHAVVQNLDIVGTEVRAVLIGMSFHTS